jgi:hypothetical protein
MFWRTMEGQPDRCSAARLALHRDDSAMQLNYPLDDRQT